MDGNLKGAGSKVGGKLVKQQNQRRRRSKGDLVFPHSIGEISFSSGYSLCQGTSIPSLYLCSFISTLSHVPLSLHLLFFLFFLLTALSGFFHEMPTFCDLKSLILAPTTRHEPKLESLCLGFSFRFLFCFTFSDLFHIIYPLRCKSAHTFLIPIII